MESAFVPRSGHGPDRGEALHGKGAASKSHSINGLSGRLFLVGAKAPSGPGPPKVGVKWCEESKLVGPEGPSGVWTPF